MMAENHFQQQIEAFDRWKRDLLGAIEDFQDWINQHDPDNGEHALQIFEAMEALRNDRLNIAFVAEFSRGKTELINAIFFANFGRRLLPSEAGRTTMCPTELFYDRDADQAYVRLLPIETRTEDTPISEYKRDPVYWTNITLDLESPEQMEDALREVIRTKQVGIEEARRLGLYSKDMHPQIAEGGPEPTEVEIPVWRHALISFPHPMLKQGLVILDTPGLNALGTEPELTMSMLPAAQAVLFLLAADTGVTRSDLDMWQYHIDGARRARRQKGIAVVLNKIDTLWDELRADNVVQSSIDAQVRKTAAMLGVDADVIFPVSAQKGLLAKVRDDRALLDRSRLKQLEDYLCNDVLPERESILRDNILGEIGGLLDNYLSVVSTRKDSAVHQRQELQSLSGKNADVIVHLMNKTREEQTTYQKNVESFQASRRLLQRQGAVLLDILSMDAMDKLISETRASMLGSWTTAGLKKGMKTLFEGMHATIDQALDQTEQTRKLVMAIYKKFHFEHGLPALKPRAFSMEAHHQQMEALYEEAEAFRQSPVTTMTEQGHLVKKFFISLVSQARNVGFKAHQEAEAWLRDVMNPLAAQIQEHKRAMERRLNTLRKISESRETLDSRIQELEAEMEQLQQQVAILQAVKERLFRPLPFESFSPASQAV